MIEQAYRLDGKSAIVVGSGAGIGRAICLTFAAAGAKVACLDVDEPSARAVADEIKAKGGTAVAIRCNVASEASVEEAAQAAIAAIGAPRVLVNAAALNDPSGTVVETTPQWWNAVLAVNLTGAFLMSRAVIPAMAAAGGGSIIHIASQLGRVGLAGRAAYTTTKGALIQLAKTMAVDHAKDRIRVNTLSPGAVETRRLEFRWGSMEKARQMSGPLHPIGRLGQPDEIALAALYLASGASAFMTGSDLLVDGGYTAV